MFKAKTSKIKLFYGYFSTLYCAIDELPVKATSEGLLLRDMDPTRVCMLDVFLPASAFDSYECTEPVNFTISLMNFIKTLKLAGENDSLELAYPVESKIAVTLEDVAKRVFFMTALETKSYEQTPTPKLEFKANVSMPTKQFLQLVRSAQMLADHCHICATPEAFTLKAKGDLMRANMTIDKNMLPSIFSTDEQKAAYSLSYLQEIVNSMSDVCENLSLNWTTDMPILIDFKLPHEGKFHFYLAPRIESDVDD